jgi:hypothetical protein
MIAAATHYLSNLSNGKLVLWCYLIWWGAAVFHHFDSSPSIWLNSVGVSAVIGVALILSVGGFNAATRDRWQTFRLFAMPFCVSSFSSLIKGKGFILVFPPSLSEMATAVALCTIFVVIVIGLRRARSVARAGASFGSPKDSIGTKQPLLAKSAKN